MERARERLEKEREIERAKETAYLIALQYFEMERERGSQRQRQME